MRSAARWTKGRATTDEGGDDGDHQRRLQLLHDLPVSGRTRTPSRGAARRRRSSSVPDQEQGRRRAKSAQPRRLDRAGGDGEQGEHADRGEADDPAPSVTLATWIACRTSNSPDLRSILWIAILETMGEHGHRRHVVLPHGVDQVGRIGASRLEEIGLAAARQPGSARWGRRAPGEGMNESAPAARWRESVTHHMKRETPQPALEQPPLASAGVSRPREPRSARGRAER